MSGGRGAAGGRSILMRTIKGPAIFLAQFAGDKAPFDTLDNICKWAADLGYEGVQIPTWVSGFIDVEKAAGSKAYADDLNGVAAKNGVQITELASHIIGQLVAVHPAYDTLSDGFAIPAVQGNPKARQEWAVQHLKWCAAASKNLGIKAHATFSGGLAWPFLYPFPQRPAGLVEEAVDELARRGTPSLDEFDREGVDVCHGIPPSEDLHDGVTYEMCLERVNNHPRANLLYDPSHFVLQQLDYLQYIDFYHERIRMFHVK